MGEGVIRITDAIYIGGSDDERITDLGPPEITAIFNTAFDLQSTRGWKSKIEYVHVGMVDGPGNEVARYCAAVLAMVSLLRRHKRVLVCDYNGGRSLAVVMMYLNLVDGKQRVTPTSWSHWLTWDQRLAKIKAQITKPLPELHPAHKEAFARIPFGVMEALL